MQPDPIPAWGSRIFAIVGWEMDAIDPDAVCRLGRDIKVERIPICLGKTIPRVEIPGRIIVALPQQHLEGVFGDFGLSLGHV
jgi:hypothetical protein